MKKYPLVNPRAFLRLKKRLCPSVWVCGELKFVALLPIGE